MFYKHILFALHQLYISPALHFFICFILNTGTCKVLIYMFKAGHTPVIELLEEEPNEDSVTISTEEETLLVGEEQG